MLGRVCGAVFVGALVCLGPAKAQPADWVRLGVVSTAAPPDSFRDFLPLFERFPEARRAHVFRFHDGRSAVGVAIMDLPGCAMEDMEPDPANDGVARPKIGCPVVVGLAEPRIVFSETKACFFAPQTLDEDQRRRNGVYARFESHRRLVELRAVVNGAPALNCDVMFSVRAE